MTLDMMPTSVIKHFYTQPLCKSQLLDTTKLFSKKKLKEWEESMRAKQCYVNAWHACQTRGVGYGEAWVVIDDIAYYHALNTKNGVFFDATNDIVLHTTSMEYYITGTCSAKHLEQMLLKMNCWGPIFQSDTICKSIANYLKK